MAGQLQEEGAGAALPAKLLDAFCRRILGFEILTAPFVVAQLQLYLILSKLGVERVGSRQRSRRPVDPTGPAGLEACAYRAQCREPAG